MNTVKIAISNRIKSVCYGLVATFSIAGLISSCGLDDKKPKPLPAQKIICPAVDGSSADGPVGIVGAMSAKIPPEQYPNQPNESHLYTVVPSPNALRIQMKCVVTGDSVVSFKTNHIKTVKAPKSEELIEIKGRKAFDFLGCSEAGTAKNATYPYFGIELKYDCAAILSECKKTCKDEACESCESRHSLCESGKQNGIEVKCE